MELQLEELETAATEDELAAEKAAARASAVQSFQRKRPSRKPFPAHLPRERILIPAPASCPCCGSAKLSKLGEDITETLEVIPRQWKVIQTVREKFSCRHCETITQPPAPFHVTPRGFAGPNLLAMILFEKFGQHQPLNRQSERYRREGIDLSLSTLADQVGACTTALQPIYALIERHVLAAERLHGDDTTVPILAKGKTVKGCIWTYVLDDRPFGDVRRRRSLLRFARSPHDIRCGTFTASPAYCRPTRITATTSCTILRALRDRSSPHSVGLMRDGSSSSWQTSPPMLGAGRMRRRSRQSRWKRSSASTRCSTSSAASMGKAPKSACGCGASRVRRFWRNWKVPAPAALAPLELRIGCRTDRLHAAAVGAVCSIRQRWSDLPDQQHGRTRPARICTGAEVVALCRLRTRRRARRLHGDARHDCEAQQCRSSSLAGRRACADRRAFHPQARRTLAVELGHREVPTPSLASRSPSMTSSPQFCAALTCRSTSGSTGCI